MGETDWGGNWVLFWWAMLNKSLIQFSVDGHGCFPSLLFDLRPNYGGGNEAKGDLLQKVLCTHCCTQWPWPCSRPLLETLVEGGWSLCQRDPHPVSHREQGPPKPLGKVNKEVYIGKRKLTTLEPTDQFWCHLKRASQHSVLPDADERGSAVSPAIKYSC